MMNEFKMPKLAGMPPLISDEALLEKAQRGDGKALEELFRRHSNHALLTARKMVGQDYEDVVQDAYAKAIEAIDQCRGAFAPWFNMIVRNMAIDRYRQNKRYADSNAPLEGANEDLPDFRYEPEISVAADASEAVHRLRTALSLLTANQREVIAALVTEVQTGSASCGLLKRTAGRLQKSEGAVRNALFQIRKTLNEHFDEEFIDAIIADDSNNQILQRAFA